MKLKYKESRGHVQDVNKTTRNIYISQNFKLHQIIAAQRRMMIHILKRQRIKLMVQVFLKTCKHLLLKMMLNSRVMKNSLQVIMKINLQFPKVKGRVWICNTKKRRILILKLATSYHKMVISCGGLL